jgi:hypothetical protein
MLAISSGDRAARLVRDQSRFKRSDTFVRRYPYIIGATLRKENEIGANASTRGANARV